MADLYLPTRASCLNDAEALWATLFGALSRDPDDAAVAVALAHVAAARDALAGEVPPAPCVPRLSIGLENMPPRELPVTTANAEEVVCYPVDTPRAPQ